MLYHTVVASLVEPHVANNIAGNIFALSAQAGDELSYIAAHSAACLETLVRLFYLRHGNDHWDSNMPQFWNLVGFNALEQLRNLPASSSRLDEQALLSTVILCANGLYEQGRNIYFSEIIYRILRKNLGPAYVHHLQDGKDEGAYQLREKHMALHSRAQFPIKVISFSEDPEIWRIDHLVSETANLEVLDDGDSG